MLPFPQFLGTSGPSLITGQILETLKNEKVTATLFFNGNFGRSFNTNKDQGADNLICAALITLRRE